MPSTFYFRFYFHVMNFHFERVLTTKNYLQDITGWGQTKTKSMCDSSLMTHDFGLNR